MTPIAFMAMQSDTSCCVWAAKKSEGSGSWRTLDMCTHVCRFRGVSEIRAHVERMITLSAYPACQKDSHGLLTDLAPKH